VGTVENMAPEVFGGAYDERADCWSLGVVTYECLFGYRPFNDICIDHIEEMVRNWKRYLVLPSQAGKVVADFINSLLIGRRERLSSAEVLSHPWITGSGSGISAFTCAMRGSASHRHLQSQVKLCASARVVGAKSGGSTTTTPGSPRTHGRLQSAPTPPSKFASSRAAKSQAKSSPKIQTRETMLGDMECMKSLVKIRKSLSEWNAVMSPELVGEKVAMATPDVSYNGDAGEQPPVCFSHVPYNGASVGVGSSEPTGAWSPARATMIVGGGSLVSAKHKPVRNGWCPATGRRMRSESPPVSNNHDRRTSMVLQSQKLHPSFKDLTQKSVTPRSFMPTPVCSFDATNATQLQNARLRAREWQPTSGRFVQEYAPCASGHDCLTRGVGIHGPSSSPLRVARPNSPQRSVSPPPLMRATSSSLIRRAQSAPRRLAPGVSATRGSKWRSNPDGWQAAGENPATGPASDMATNSADDDSKPAVHLNATYTRVNEAVKCRSDFTIDVPLEVNSTAGTPSSSCRLSSIRPFQSSSSISVQAKVSEQSAVRTILSPTFPKYHAPSVSMSPVVPGTPRTSLASHRCRSENFLDGFQGAMAVERCEGPLVQKTIVRVPASSLHACVGTLC